MSDFLQSARLELLAFSAHGLGLITDLEYEDMTDGRSSYLDRRAANSIATGERADSDIARALGRELKDAIQDEIDGQGVFKTLAEDMAELFPRLMDRPEKPETALARPSTQGVGLRQKNR